MKPLLRPICWLQTVYYTYRYGSPQGIFSGHTYYEWKTDKDDRGIAYDTLCCERCGQLSYAWNDV